jgi:hypothetical protein
VRRGRVLLLVVGAASLLATVVPTPTTASAVDAVESGWWSRGNGGGVPPPPGAPADGLQVAADPVGPSAVAAVRFTLAAGEANPVLALTIDAADNPTAATLTACRAKAARSTAQAGPWSSRPDYDCSAGVVTGAVSTDQKTATFDLRPLADESGVVDVVLFAQPGPPPSGVPAAPISPGVVSFTFAKVTSAAVRVDAGGTGGGSTAADPVAPPLDADKATPAFDLPSVTPAPSVDLGLPAVAPPTPAPTATARTAPAPVAAPTALAAPAFEPASIVRDDRRTRLLCAFVFADLALWWYWVTFRRAQPETRPAAPPLR